MNHYVGGEIMTIEEILDGLEPNNNKYIEREREKQRKLQQKAKTRKAIITVLAILFLPIVIFVLVIAELMRTTK